MYTITYTDLHPKPSHCCEQWTRLIARKERTPFCFTSITKRVAFGFAHLLCHSSFDDLEVDRQCKTVRLPCLRTEVCQVEAERTACVHLEKAPIASFRLPEARCVGRR